MNNVLYFSQAILSWLILLSWLFELSFGGLLAPEPAVLAPESATLGPTLAMAGEESIRLAAIAAFMSSSSISDSSSASSVDRNCSEGCRGWLVLWVWRGAFVELQDLVILSASSGESHCPYPLEASEEEMGHSFGKFPLTRKILQPEPFSVSKYAER